MVFDTNLDMLHFDCQQDVASKYLASAGCPIYIKLKSPFGKTMLHRHLNDNCGTSLPAIDDIISRGLWQDWVELRQAVPANPLLLERIEHVCQAYVSNPYAQRHHFWMNYVKRKQSPS